MANKNMKRSWSSHAIGEKCLRQQWDINTHLLEWSNYETLTNPNTGEEVEQRELSFIAGRNAKRCSCFRWLVASYIIIYTPTVQSSKHAPWYLPKQAKNLRSHKNMHLDVYSCFIHNCKNVEATKISFSKWMDKLWHSRQWDIIQH